ESHPGDSPATSGSGAGFGAASTARVSGFVGVGGRLLVVGRGAGAGSTTGSAGAGTAGAATADGSAEVLLVGVSSGEPLPSAEANTRTPTTPPVAQSRRRV